MTDSSSPSSPASRKKPTTSLVRGMDELDAVGALTLPKRTSVVPREQPDRKNSPSVPTLAAVAGATPSGVSEVNDQHAQASSPRVTRPVVHAAPKRPPSEPSVWPQWAFAAAVLGVALWYLFSTEPSRKVNRAVQVEQRALTPGR
jgi:hypothetical protein